MNSLSFGNTTALYLDYLNNSAPRVRSFSRSAEVDAITSTIVTMKKVAPPVMIVLGTIGNSLGLVVLYRSSVFKQSSVCYYLRAFFVTSILVLYLGAGLDWVCRMAQLPHPWDVTDGLCRIWYFFSNVVFFSPIWFCVAIVIDRYTNLCHQRTAESMCSQFSAKIFIIAIQVGLILVSIHAMWTYELHSKFGCLTPAGRRDFHSIVWPWVSVIIYTFLPLFILLLFNIVISIVLCSRHRCRDTVPDGRSSFNDNSALTVTSLAVTTAYVTLALPATIMNVYMSQAPPSWIAATPESYYRHQLLGEIFQQLAILNHAIMGAVCFCSSGMFRNETFSLFLKKTPRSGIEMTADDENPCKYRPSNGSLTFIYTDNSNL